ncbi:hypothetical protein OFB51_26955, partial [Escherichia coli]|nr:hypothetical protein [Escherichia coli]
MLQYALLHLYGYALTIDDLKAFRVSAHSFLAEGYTRLTQHRANSVSTASPPVTPRPTTPPALR